MLYNLLLALNYNVQLCTDKTKLQMYADKTFSVPLNLIIINGEQDEFSDEAEHVGFVLQFAENI